MHRNPTYSEEELSLQGTKAVRRVLRTASRRALPQQRNSTRYKIGCSTISGSLPRAWSCWEWKPPQPGKISCFHVWMRPSYMWLQDRHYSLSNLCIFRRGQPRLMTAPRRLGASGHERGAPKPTKGHVLCVACLPSQVSTSPGLNPSRSSSIWPFPLPSSINK